MGKPTGFMEAPRVSAPKRDKHERLADSREFILPLASEAKTQAARCMDCGVPFCQQGCPLGNPIPDFNDLVYRDRWQAAFAQLSSTNNFPEFTGRLCPAPCESACVLAINQEPVTIEQIEKEIAERAFAEGWVQPRPPSHRTGKKVAVVGSGPAGLAAAAQLNQAGHSVTVFERDDALGGLLRYGIPDFKMEKSVIDRRLHVLHAEGVAFKTSADVGSAISYDTLRNEHDAVVLAMGARKARELDVPGRQLDGVLQAMPYLEAQNRAVQSGARSLLHAEGKRVVILGGGDTGSDCLGTALRQGAADVRQVELLPAPPLSRSPGNPWPQWPLVFRTSSSQDEGGERRFGLLTKELVARDGKLSALKLVSVDFINGKLEEVAGTEQRIEAELLILALGFVGPDTSAVTAQLKVELDARGNVKTNGQFATNVPGVFCAGDAYRGQSLIVWAISDGREAARGVDSYLTGAPSKLPTRGVHQPFGGR